MMGMSTPSTAQIADVLNFLEILKIASDPALSKEMLERFAQERKIHEDAIEQAALRTKSAASDEQHALEVIQLAADAEKKIAIKQGQLTSRITEIEASRKVLDEDRALLEAEKFQFSHTVQAHQTAKEEQEAAIAEERKAIDTERAAIQHKVAELNERIEAAEAMRAEYEAKLAQFKALAA